MTIVDMEYLKESFNSIEIPTKFWAWHSKAAKRGAVVSFVKIAIEYESSYIKIHILYFHSKVKPYCEISFSK